LMRRKIGCTRRKQSSPCLLDEVRAAGCEGDQEKK
jgi:hypothetical protein